MDFNTTDQQDVEKLKKWWNENGRSLVTGLVLGIAGILGWQYWQNYATQRSEVASMEFELLMAALQAGRTQEVESRAEQLQLNLAATPYAALGSLAVARSKLDAGDHVGAEANLQWVVDNAANAAIADLALLRLVRVYLDAGNVAQARALIPAVIPVGFESLFAELLGDIAMEEGQSQQARDAYVRALAAMKPDDVRRPMVQMKHDDLGNS